MFAKAQREVRDCTESFGMSICFMWHVTFGLAVKFAVLNTFLQNADKMTDSRLVQRQNDKIPLRTPSRGPSASLKTRSDAFGSKIAFDDAEEEITSAVVDFAEF